MKDMLVFLTTSEEALEVYKDLSETLPAAGLQLRTNIPPQALDLGSAPLQQVRHSLPISLQCFPTILSQARKITLQEITPYSLNDKIIIMILNQRALL